MFDAALYCSMVSSLSLVALGSSIANCYTSKDGNALAGPPHGRYHPDWQRLGYRNWLLAGGTRNIGATGRTLKLPRGVNQ